MIECGLSGLIGNVLNYQHGFGDANLNRLVVVTGGWYVLGSFDVSTLSSSLPLLNDLLHMLYKVYHLHLLYIVQVLSIDTAQCIACPLVTSEEHSTSDTDPSDSRLDTLEESFHTFLFVDFAEQRRGRDSFFCQHHSRLQDIQRCGQGSSNTAGYASKHSRLETSSSFPAVSFGSPSLHALPHGELDDGKRHLTHHRDTPPAIQLPRHNTISLALPQVKNTRKRSQRTRELLRLSSLLDDFGRHTDSTRRYFAQTRRCHVYASLLCGSVLCRGEVALYAVVGDEEEGGAWSGADDGGTDACVDAAEAAGGEEA